MPPKRCWSVVLSLLPLLLAACASATGLPSTQAPSPVPTLAATLAPTAATQASPQPPPDGTYVAKISVDEMEAAGMSQRDACENAGTLTLEIKGARLAFSQVAASGCSVANPSFAASWTQAGDQAMFNDDLASGCSQRYTYRYTFDGRALRFTKVDDACAARVLFMTLEPWILQ
jgi:hypothetical protein